MSSWHLQPVFDSYLYVVGIATVLGLLLLVGPAFRRLSRPRRLVLAALRTAVILLVVLALVRPTFVRTVRKPQTAALLVMFDQSRSMQLPHGNVQQSRWAAQRALLQQVAPLLQQLDETLALKVYGYDETLVPAEWQDGRFELGDQPQGDQTDIGSTLHDALQREVGKRLAAVILLGDGAQTAFEPRFEIQEAARELARLGCPLYAVPFGPATGAVQARDVAVENLQDQYTVFVQNDFTIRASVRVRGFVNQPIPVTLRIDRPDGQTQQLGPIPVTARTDDEQLPVEFRYLPDQPGRYKLTLEAAEQAGELVVKNNALSAFLRVLEGGLRVLYLEGDLRWEQKFLRRGLDAAADMEVDFVWVDSAQRDRWPIDLASLLDERAYDVFILGDLDSTALGTANLERLAQQVENGKGLAALGGYHSFGAGGYHDTPIADVLPIEMNRFERQDFDAPLRADLQLSGPLKMQPLVDHPILRLAAGDDNDRIWKQLAALDGANRFAGVKQAAGVRVLAESPDGDPLLVVGEYGRGRVVAFAGDSTWRWAMQGQEAEFRRFWRQIVLWLVRREDLRRDEVWVELEQRRYRPDSDVTFRTSVRSPSGEAVPDASLQAELQLPDGGRRPIRIAKQPEDWLGIIDSLTQPGDYTIEVTARRGGEELGRGSAEFLVFDRDAELSNPAADHDQLARLASGTEAAGGRLVPPELLASLLEELRDRPPEMEREIQSKWQLADSWQDAWTLLVLFVLLLAGEWFLRKRWGLV